ncbi:ABC transporter ATP-binding protein [Aerococcaceae bacterium WGS1372]
MAEILKIKHLNLSFESEETVQQVLKDITFSVEEGEIVGIVGESGSGKSMTARAITQLLPDNATVHPGSEIEFKEQQLLGMKPKKMRKILGEEMGMIFQDPLSSLNPMMTVGDQIAEVLQLHQPMRRKARHQRVVELMTSIGIKDADQRYSHYPHEFSGGMRQRIMIAIALAANPSLLIADEPTTALDVTIQAQILELIKKLQADLNLSVLLISHDFGVVAQLCTRVIVMKDGEIVEQCSIKDIFHSPQHPYTKKLLDAVPRLDQEKLESEKVATQPLIKVEGVHQVFDIGKGKRLKALNHIDLSIHRGETLGLVGESGSGKSTLGRAILQLNQPSSGRVLFEGFDLGQLTKAEMLKVRKDMQIIFQDPYASLNPRMKIEDIIGEALDTHKLVQSAGERSARIEELLQLVELDPSIASRYPHEFSGGQRQRIGIARALAVEPTFIVADEPLSALDVSIQAQILDLLKQLQKKLNLTILFIAHDLAVVKQISDRVAVMRQGQIVELASTQKLYDNPLHPYTQKLIQAVSSLDLDNIEEKMGDGLPVDSTASSIVLATDNNYAKDYHGLYEVHPGHFVGH